MRPNPSLLSGLPQHSVLSPAFASCKANNSIPPNILFSNHHYIRIVDLNGDSEIFAKNQSNAVAIDYDCRSEETLLRPAGAGRYEHPGEP